jgi:hypothetical protein
MFLPPWHYSVRLSVAWSSGYHASVNTSLITRRSSFSLVCKYKYRLRDNDDDLRYHLLMACKPFHTAPSEAFVPRAEPLSRHHFREPDNDRRSAAAFPPRRALRAAGECPRITPTIPTGAAVPGGHLYTRVASHKARHAHRLSGPASSSKRPPESRVCRSSFYAR